MLSLARRPGPGDGVVLGYHGLYREDHGSRLVFLDEAGVTEDGLLMRFADIDDALADDEGSA